MFFRPLFGSFNPDYRAYPVAFIERQTAENGDKIILPQSALHALASMDVEYPMLFRIDNRQEGRHSHCGVLEFIAEEGTCYLPQWMMDNLLLTVGSVVSVKNVSLPKGSFIKIQPHTKDFLDIANPKAVLETSLRNFTCLTQGDTFVIDYNDRKYHIDVIEVKPSAAVSVVETDIEVDFAPPKDYKEPEPEPPAAAPEPAASAEPAPEEEDPKPSFVAFQGSGNRVDGRPVAAKPMSIPEARPSGPQRRGSSGAIAGSADSNTSGPSRQGNSLKSGKMVFGGGGSGSRLADRLAKKSGQGSGSGAAASAQPAPRPPDKDKEQEDPDKFKPFQGRGRKLAD